MTTAETGGFVAAPSHIGKFKILIFALIILVVAEQIGATTFKLGPGSVTLLPMLWALLLAAVWGACHARLPQPLSVGRSAQVFAGAVLNTGLLFFIVKMGLTVGPALPQVKAAGWALLFQEGGHFFGTLVLGLPLALLLGIKREAVGSTFSVGRETSLMIIGDRYGLDSSEGRGVLAEYVTGTVLGAVFLAVLAGFIASLGIFDPRSLAMGAGVGSGSMMAAALGAVVTQADPSRHGELTAIASAANLLTGVIGFYFTAFISLPLCSWLYYRLEPVLGRFSKPVTVDNGGLTSTDAPQGFALPDMIGAWIFMCVGASLSNLFSWHVPLATSLEGMLVITGFVAVVSLLKMALPRLPILVVLSLAATGLSIPGLSPAIDTLVATANQVNFLALTTPALALAGFSVAKDLPIFRRLGWRIVVVSLTATAGTFLGATLIAEFFH